MKQLSLKPSSLDHSRVGVAPIPRWLYVFFALAVVLAAILRFSWLADMEWKFDERWMFIRAMRIPAREPWPELGMVSGTGLRNPGLSVSIFALLAKLTGATQPLELCTGVVACSALAFLVFFVFVVRQRSRQHSNEQREVWLWALALSAVSPISILLQRKIWAQSILPLFCVLFLMGWLRRYRFWGACLWGFIGAILGQIHMSGLFFAAGFLGGELTLGRLRANPPKTKWLGWLVGSAAGAWPLIPWIKNLVTTSDRRPSHWWKNVLSFRFYRYWFTDSLGLGLDYSLGAQFSDFLRYPRVETGGFRPVLYLHGIALALGLCVFFFVLFSVGRTAWGVIRGAGLRASQALAEVMDQTMALVYALVGYGLLLTLSGVVVHRHYLVVTFPLEWLLVAAVALKYVRWPRPILLSLWVVQLALSLAFLHYIHENHGAIRGDYGRGYRWSAERGTAR